MATQTAKAKRTNGNGARAAASPRPATGGRAAQQGLDPAEVARVAYALFLERGGEHGHDLEDWVRAEGLVRQRKASRR